MSGKYYSPQQRREILELFDAGVSVYRLHKHFGVKEDTIRNWKNNREKYLAPDSKEKMQAILAGKSTIAGIPEHGLNASNQPGGQGELKTFVDPCTLYVPQASAIWISDLHAPFMHQDAPAFIKELHSIAKPRRVMFAGDETDQHALGKYPANPDGMSPGKEFEAALEQLLPLYRAFPVAYICESNHAIRAAKKAFITGLPQAFLKNLEQAMNAPEGWRWAEHWVFDDVMYCHGDPYHGRNAVVKHMHENFMSVAIGHTHSYGRVEYFQTRHRRFFALDGGCLIDDSAYAFRYGAKINRKPTLGSGIIYDRENAEFITMELDAHKRWTGKIKRVLG